MIIRQPFKPINRLVVNVRWINPERITNKFLVANEHFVRKCNDMFSLQIIAHAVVL
jgi:hypothetical protein